MDSEKRDTVRFASLMALVLLLGALAAMAIVKYTFDGPGFSATWPLLFIGAGLALAVARYYVPAIVLVGFFGIVFAANLGAFSLRRAWPFGLLIILAAAIVGYLQARSGESPGPKSTIRE